MIRPVRPVATMKRKPFFGEWPPVVVSTLLLLLGLAAVTTFYASVFAAAHAVVASAGTGHDQIATVTPWVCALFLLQGSLPLMRFGVSDLPELIGSGRFRVKALDALLFVLMLAIGAALVLV